VKGLLPLLPKDLQKVLESEGVFSVSSKLNKDGQWECIDLNTVRAKNDNDSVLSDDKVIYWITYFRIHITYAY
jgi:hypothetical protein